MTITGTPFLLLDRELARSNVRADAEKVRGFIVAFADAPVQCNEQDSLNSGTEQ